MDVYALRRERLAAVRDDLDDLEARQAARGHDPADDAVRADLERRVAAANALPARVAAAIDGRRPGSSPAARHARAARRRGRDGRAGVRDAAEAVPVRPTRVAPALTFRDWEAVRGVPRRRPSRRSRHDWWFPTRHDAGGRGGGYRGARAICSSCPVRVRCLEEALTVEANCSQNEIAGMFGGASPQGRVQLRRQRRRRAVAV